jgi:hypothetical protein
MSDDQLRQCCRLAKFIAHLRARPGSKQKESAERELSPRLTSQMTRLALSLAVVMNKSSVDSRVMRRVTKIALDTSRGQTMEICKRLLEVGRKGLTHQAIALKLNETDSNMVTFLKFLAKIKVVERYFPGEDGRKALRPKWRLTVKMTKLWESIIETAIEGVTNAV